MKRGSKITIITLAIVLAISTITTVVLLYAETQGRGFLWKLDPEVREDVHAKIQEMREAGASREEIHSEVKAMLEAQGIEVPEQFGKGRRHGLKRLMSQLNEEQREEVEAKFEELRNSDATREEIHEQMKVIFEGYGLELPEPGMGGGPGGFRGALHDQLTDEQREAIKAKCQELRENDVPQNEIRKEIRNMMKQYGVDFSEMTDKRYAKLQERFGEELTEEQQNAIKEKSIAMWEEGATGAEIHEEVRKMLESYGIEVPEGRGPGMRGGMRRHIMSQLNEEQREALKEKRIEMREQGATREEVREEIRKMLEGYGVECPNWKDQGGTPGNSMMDPIKGSGTGNLRALNYPNPFNPETNIEYYLVDDGYATVAIYDLQGKVVKTLFTGDQNAGSHVVNWDGLNADGEKVASGVYFYKVQSGGEIVAKQIIMLE